MRQLVVTRPIENIVVEPGFCVVDKAADELFILINLMPYHHMAVRVYFTCNANSRDRSCFVIGRDSC